MRLHLVYEPAREKIMRRTMLISTVLVSMASAWMLLSSNSTAAEENSAGEQKKSLIQHIDGFGRSVVGGIFGQSKQESGRRPTGSAAEPDPISSRSRTPQKVSNQYLNQTHPAPSRLLERGDSSPISRANRTPERSPSTSFNAQISETPRESAAGSNSSSLNSPSTLSDTAEASVTKGLVMEQDVEQPHPSALRLHERLSVLRNSAFDSFPVPPSSQGDVPMVAARPEREPVHTEPEVAPPDAAQDQPGVFQDMVAANPASDEPAKSDAAATPHHVRPTLAPPADSLIAAEPQLESQVDVPATQSLMAEDTIDQRPIAESPIVESPVAEAPAVDSVPIESVPNTTPIIAEAATPLAPTTPAIGEDVLFSRQSPILDVRTVGPRRITVGKESDYVLTIRNSGPVAADQVIVAVDLPDWTDVVGSDPTCGSTGRSNTATGTGAFIWNVGRLEAQGTQRLVLNVVPRASRPFDLTVRWDYTPVSSQAMIEVQEPIVEARLDGPRQILYGTKETYKLVLLNSGNGAAENLSIALVASVSGGGPAASHNIGTLGAGEQKTVEVELTARQVGALTVAVDARCDGNVHVHLDEVITVLRPALKAAIEAPQRHYVNAEASYLVRVSNPGTATAKNVRVTATLPPSAEYVLSSRGGVPQTDSNDVIWVLPSLAPGAQETFDLTCRLRQAGSNRLVVATTAEDDLIATSEGTTMVETMADLVLDVQDPAGPVKVGSNAAYKLAIQNRGSDTARDVEVLVYFSRGIEPTSAQGVRHKLGPGQIVFDTIPALGPGENVAVEINAKADTPGNHIFRVEVYCKASGIRLVSEEMTHYYGMELAGQSSPSTTVPFGSAIRTAERPRATDAD